VLDSSISETELGLNHFVIGTDEVMALVNAVESSFPSSRITLCTRHFEENLKRHLKNRIGVNEKYSQEMVINIFGTNGLSAVDTTVVYKISRNSRKKFNWKNNNCESMNHELKLNQNWTPQKIPNLVE
jgi:transposase-like protein